MEAQKTWGIVNGHLRRKEHLVFKAKKPKAILGNAWAQGDGRLKGILSEKEMRSEALPSGLHVAS